jgi:hypothetical protein
MTGAFLGISYAIWALICLGVSVLYFFVWPSSKPERRTPRPAWIVFILRWFHSLVWLLLAGACLFLWLEFAALASYLAFAGLIAFVIFMLTMFLDRRVGA